MRKLACSLTISMVFAVAACGGDDESPATQVDGGGGAAGKSGGGGASGKSGGGGASGSSSGGGGASGSSGGGGASGSGSTPDAGKDSSTDVSVTPEGGADVSVQPEAGTDAKPDVGGDAGDGSSDAKEGGADADSSSSAEAGDAVAAEAGDAGVLPYLVPVGAIGIQTKILLTVGDSAPGPDGGAAYRFAGIPDGLGAFDNGNGTFTLLVNHEITGTAGVARAHGGIGAFVSKWTIRKADQAVLNGEDLIKQTVTWSAPDAAAPGYLAPSTGTVFSRFCSADLAPLSAFYFNGDGGAVGYNGLLFLNGEESGDEGRAWAHAMDGTSYQLPRLGRLSWENSVAHPGTGLKTVVVGLDDTTPGQVYVYVGTKTNTGNPAEKAGLTNGTLYGVKVAGYPTEVFDGGTFPTTSPFTLADLGNVDNSSGATLQAASVTAGVTEFFRPEDGSWDPENPKDFYFVTTASFTAPSRLWRLRFTDVTNPQNGGELTMLLDGTEGQKMFDNITVDHKGHVYLQEDIGAQDAIGKVWRYTVATDTLVQIAEHNPALFTPAAPGFLTRDEESSGIIDASAVLGPGWFLLDVQAHYATTTELVEGGQLLALYDPAAVP